MGSALSRLRILTFTLLAASACGTSAEGEHAHDDHAPRAAPATSAGADADVSSASPIDQTVDAVRAIHGGAGPWAVAGYRMGNAALKELELTRGSFDLEVVHHTPKEVQYSCIADGAAAATGASVGKLNLSLEEAPAAETRTTYRRRSTGASVTLRLTEGFKARFFDVPRAELASAGREAAGLSDAEIFEVTP